MNLHGSFVRGIDGDANLEYSPRGHANESSIWLVIAGWIRLGKGSEYAGRSLKFQYQPFVRANSDSSSAAGHHQIANVGKRFAVIGRDPLLCHLSERRGGQIRSVQ